MPEVYTGPIEKIDDYRWRLPRSYDKGMRVDGIIYTSEKTIDTIRKDATPLQVIGVAHLPGIVKASLAMPDIHWGYGFPIGGVAGVLIDDGVVSPGGVGYDINCGVRTIRTNFTIDEMRPKLREIIDALFSAIPCGLGKGGRLKVSNADLKQVILKGSLWAVEQDYGTQEDILRTEANGCIEGADPDVVSDRAKERGRPQLGTLGSGNHFIEIQVVTDIYDDKVADVFGIFKNQVLVMIHTGSRGFGYQICDDNLRVMERIQDKYSLKLPDKQLASAPIKSPEGSDYISGMAGAANFAWCNRQIITHWLREVFYKVLNTSPELFGGEVIYDVAHNIAKFEEHIVDGKKVKVLVHRKGATRAFSPRHPEVPECYKDVGQPVIVPGDMGTASYILVGTDRAMDETFGSTCHGAGRLLSRHAAMKQAKGRAIDRELEKKGILVRAFGRGTLAEEMPEAYKDVDEVVEVVDGAGISKKVAKMRPLAVMKG
ncbi:MAG: RtcB family protein [bacterium]